MSNVLTDRKKSLSNRKASSVPGSRKSKKLNPQTLVGETGISDGNDNQ